MADSPGVSGLRASRIWIRPSQRGGLVPQRRVAGQVEQQAAASVQVVGQPGAVVQFQVRRAPAGQLAAA